MPDLSAFQRVLEALQEAQTMGALVAADDNTTREMDDQDCYPRGLLLDVDRKDPVWHSIRFLSKHLDWVTLETRSKCLMLEPPQPLRFRLTQVVYLDAVADSLTKSGIKCTPYVYYR